MSIPLPDGRPWTGTDVAVPLPRPPAFSDIAGRSKTGLGSFMSAAAAASGDSRPATEVWWYVDDLLPAAACLPLPDARFMTVGSDAGTGGYSGLVPLSAELVPFALVAAAAACVSGSRYGALAYTVVPASTASSS